MRERRNGAIATCNRQGSQSLLHSSSPEVPPPPPFLEAALLLASQAGRKIREEGYCLPTINTST